MPASLNPAQNWVRYQKLGGIRATRPFTIRGYLLGWEIYPRLNFHRMTFLSHIFSLALCEGLSLTTTRLANSQTYVKPKPIYTENIKDISPSQNSRTSVRSATSYQQVTRHCQHRRPCLLTTASGSGYFCKRKGYRYGVANICLVSVML
jgi:hypothetical protein